MEKDVEFSVEQYDYPFSLYCVNCDKDVDVILETEVEELVKDDKVVEAPFRVAVCPICHCVVCDRDRSYAIIRTARKEGLL